MWLYEAEIAKKLKLFGTAAQRVTTEEMTRVFEELKHQLNGGFGAFELVRVLASKEDHGDIDILVLSQGQNIEQFLIEKLGDNVITVSKNGTTTSILYKSPTIQKTVHVDFIASGKSEELASKRHYYAFGDTSAVVGVLSKSLHFKYGTEGFFKRFQDKKGTWHDIPITHDLLLGMRILGFPNPEQYQQIKTHDDIVEFMKSNPMTDSDLFDKEAMTCADRQSVGRRPGMDYICAKLRDLGLHRKIQDEDFFLKQHPDLYQRVESGKKEIDSKGYAKSSVYNGGWLMQQFGLKPGPQIGQILLAITKKFGEGLHTAPEAEVRAFVQGLL